MTKRNDGGPAFPIVAPHGIIAVGMSQRKVYALGAEMAWLGSGRAPKDDAEFAAWCFRVADAMVAESEKGGGDVQN